MAYRGCPAAGYVHQENKTGTVKEVKRPWLERSAGQEPGCRDLCKV